MNCRWTYIGPESRTSCGHTYFPGGAKHPIVPADAEDAFCPWCRDLIVADDDDPEDDAESIEEAS